jgi:beta-lactamase superfamily II metal-dependent hydrolase
MYKLLCCTLFCFSSAAFPVHGQQLDEFFKWEEGYLDIHHINTARGNATFFVFPDGTTMLFDVGAKKVPVDKIHEYFITPSNDSLSTGEWIAYYVKEMAPAGSTPEIDYAVISHFHNDHYGEIDSGSRKSQKLSYFLSGITEVGDIIPIKKLIDRGYPSYTTPRVTGLYQNDKTFSNYLAFIAEQKSHSQLEVEMLIAGRNNQIILKKDSLKYKSFNVRNVKANTTLWSGKGNGTTEFNHPVVRDGELDENALSLALKISYGNFDYYTGGDLNGYTKWGGIDMETLVAKVIGKMDVIALNHHGYYDATNSFFLRTLSPTVAVHQVIHDPHFQVDVLQRLSNFNIDLFTYNIHESFKTTLPKKITDLYKSTSGHVVLRVMPGGSWYNVYILNDNGVKLNCINKFGPYLSK